MPYFDLARSLALIYDLTPVYLALYSLTLRHDFHHGIAPPYQLPITLVPSLARSTDVKNYERDILTQCYN